MFHSFVLLFLIGISSHSISIIMFFYIIKLMRKSTIFILIIISVLSFSINVILSYHLLGFSNLQHVPITLAWIKIGSSIIASYILYIEAFIAMYLFITAISEQQFIFISALYFASLLPNLLLFIRRFYLTYNNDDLITLVRLFSFLYILAILLIAYSLVIVNFRYHKSVVVFFILVGISILIARSGLIGFSKAIGVYDVFMGGQWLLAGSGLALSIIALIVYIIDLYRLELRVRLIIGRMLYLLGLIATMHLILFFSISSTIIVITATSLMSVCLYGYLRNIFLNVI